MNPPIKIISTDFDGTVHTDFESPPIPSELQGIIGGLQRRGVSWVINTGRDLPSLLDSLNSAHVGIRPDYVVVVEREIYQLQKSEYISVADWNDRCTALHAELFSRVHPHLPKVMEWIKSKFRATVYSDPYSPLCLIAESSSDAEEIHNYLDVYYKDIADLVVMRNDVYARFSHKAYNKGTALAEIARRLKVSPSQIVAAGDHLNDLPMLKRDYAHWLLAPFNAIPSVKEAVIQQNGYVSEKHCGHGVAHGLKEILKSLGFSHEAI